jgi:hypothetical protein
MRVSSFIHLTANNIISFFFMAEQKISTEIEIEIEMEIFKKGMYYKCKTILVKTNTINPFVSTIPYTFSSLKCLD